MGSGFADGNVADDGAGAAWGVETFQWGNSGDAFANTLADFIFTGDGGGDVVDGEGDGAELVGLVGERFAGAGGGGGEGVDRHGGLSCGGELDLRVGGLCEDFPAGPLVTFQKNGGDVSGGDLDGVV